MKTEVDNYRGWEITFDTDKESFTAYSNTHDSEVEKPSYASIKKYIDDFLKDNQNFKPFMVEYDPTGYSSREKSVKVIGLRKDNAFVGEDENGKKFQIGKYEEDSYILAVPENVAVVAEYKRLLDEADKYRDLAKKYIEKNLKRKTLLEIKKELL